MMMRFNATAGCGSAASPPMSGVVALLTRFGQNAPTARKLMINKSETTISIRSRLAVSRATNQPVIMLAINMTKRTIQPSISLSLTLPGDRHRDKPWLMD
jgi:hypothetical protein